MVIILTKDATSVNPSAGWLYSLTNTVLHEYSDLSRLAASIKERSVNPRTSHRTIDVVLGFLQVYLYSFGTTFETAAEKP